MGKHVPSAVPGHGPQDMSAELAAHREREQGVTGQATVGMNPDPPDQRVTSDPGDPVATAGPEAIAYFPQGTGW